MVHLALIRHAQSEWNAEGRWQGRADPPLSAGGEAQARLAGEHLAEALGSGLAPGPLRSLWSSDLQRARRTAHLIGAAVGWSGPTGEVPELGEHDVGEWSGLTHAEIEQRWPGWIAAWASGRVDATPGGERRGDFDARVHAGLLRIATPAAASGEGVTLVVTHGGVLRSIARRLGLPERAPTQLEGLLLEVPPADRPVVHGNLSLLSGWDVRTTAGQGAGRVRPDEAL